MSPTTRHRTASRKASASARKAPRPYMEKDERKRMLLEVAATIVETRDWSELKMSELAAYAGISRQLVYQHFPNLQSLLIETCGLVFQDLWIATQTLIDDESIDLATAVRRSAESTLDFAPGKGDALWQILAGFRRNDTEFQIISQQIRDVAIDMWLPRVQKSLGLKKPAARALIWMQLMGFWSLRQLVRDGHITRKIAMEQFSKSIGRVLQPDTQVN